MAKKSKRCPDTLDMDDLLAEQHGAEAASRGETKEQHERRLEAALPARSTRRGRARQPSRRSPDPDQLNLFEAPQPTRSEPESLARRPGPYASPGGAV